MNIFLYILAWLFYRTINRRRDRRWRSMTPEVRIRPACQLACLLICTRYRT